MHITYRSIILIILLIVSSVTYADQRNVYFNQPDLISAFYSGDTAPLHQNLLVNLTYVAGIQQFLSSDRVLFIVENRNLITEINPTLSHEISKRIMTSRKGMNQAIDAGLQSIFGIFKGIADARREGLSVRDEVSAANRAIINSPMVRLEVIQKQAIQDAQRLTILYDADPEVFRRIYDGMQKFVMEI